MRGSRLAIGGAVLAVAVGFVGSQEGLSLSAYRDTGNVPTICYGSTRGVRIGQRATKADCAALLTADLIDHETGMRACLKAPDALPDETYVAFLSFTYNVGIGAACHSTAFRLVNAGNLRAACDQLPRWNKDNGRIIRGLTRRRAAERDLCLAGLH